jgi:nucleotide-binding universal stress UspA family protein
MIAGGPIVVGIDASPGADAALRWAVADAATRGAPVRAVCAYRRTVEYAPMLMWSGLPEPEVQHARDVAEGVVAKAIKDAAELDASVCVHGEAIDGNPVPVLVEESHRGSLLVLGSRHQSAVGASVLGSVSAGVAARSTCPVVVLGGPAAVAGEGSSVIVGVDGREESELLSFAFDHASRHRAPLQALLVWHPDLLVTMMWRARSAVPMRAEVWLSEALAGWSAKYPDVEVHSAVIRDHPAAGLTSWASSAQLLVVGSRGHRGAVGTMLGSVSQAVLHHATCPIAVVPTMHLEAEGS